MGAEASWWVVLAYVTTALMILWHWSTILFAGFYQRALYPRRLKGRYDPAFLPRCTVIIPCKGTPPHAERNLRAFLQQDYPVYEVIFAVEAENDAAVPIIARLVAADERASLVVAGLASTCAQKVHNLLAAVQCAGIGRADLGRADLGGTDLGGTGARRSGAPEVLVFADNDIGPAPEWLRELVLPLSDPAVSIATGFCWLRGRDGAFGELAHSFTSMFQYVVFTWLAYWNGIGVWGGTTAMRRRDFDRLGVAARWQESVVDDMSLSQIAMRHGLRTVLVPLCITPSDNVLGTVGGFTAWCARQLLYVKAYHPALWLASLAMACGVALIYALLPLAILGALLTPRSFWGWGGGAALLLVGAEMLTVLLYALLGPVPHLAKFVLFAPALRWGQIVGALKTAGTRTIAWGGVRYTFDRCGRVTRIER